jgi:membrane protein YqaA with SNARE-associated domain
VNIGQVLSGIDTPWRILATCIVGAGIGAAMGWRFGW